MATTSFGGSFSTPWNYGGIQSQDASSSHGVQSYGNSYPSMDNHWLFGGGGAPTANNAFYQSNIATNIAGANDAYNTYMQALSTVQNQSNPNSDFLKNLNSITSAASNTYRQQASSAAASNPASYNFNDLNSKSEAKNKAALQVFQNMFDRLDNQTGGRIDGIVSTKDMRAALNDNTGRYTDQEKAAMKYIFNAGQSKGSNDTNWGGGAYTSTSLFSAMDGSDGKVGKSDLADLQKTNLAPDKITDDIAA